MGSLVPFPGDLKYTGRREGEPGVRVLDLEGLTKEVGWDLIVVNR